MADSTPLTIEAALLATYSSSKEAYEQTETLRKYLGFQSKPPMIRMAIGRSLGETAPLKPGENWDRKGKPNRGDTLFGGISGLPLWLALLVTHFHAYYYPQREVTLESIQEMVAYHWHRGIGLLMDDWNEAVGDYRRFVEIQITRRAVLPEQAGSKGRTTDPPWPLPVSSGGVAIELGREETSGEPFAWTVNGVGYSPHIAIMGQAGAGKTRAMLQSIQQIHEQTNAPVLLLDLGKGDLADKPELARELGATVLRVPESPIPLDMFHGVCGSEQDAKDGVIALWDSLCKLPMVKGLGAVQKEHFRDALVPLFSHTRAIPFEQVRERIVKFYHDKDFRPDSVISLMNDLSVRQIFTPKCSPDEFFAQSWIITFGQASDTVKNLAAYLLLDALNAFFKSQLEAGQDDSGHRAIRMVLAVDEARNLLAARHQGLSDNIRLHRSKGLVVMLASQSPDDYTGASDDYLENIGLPICFKTNAGATKIIQNMFRGTTVNFSSLGSGVCLTLKDGQAARVRVFRDA